MRRQGFEAKVLDFPTRERFVAGGPPRSHGDTLDNFDFVNGFALSRRQPSMSRAVPIDYPTLTDVVIPGRHL